MTSPPLRTALGLMSGTSLDGIDAALIRTDGISHVETGAHLTIPYGDEFRAKLRELPGRQGSGGRGRARVDRTARRRGQAAGAGSWRHRSDRLPRPYDLPCARPGPDMADRRRVAAGAADRHPRGVRFPHRRRRGRRPGRSAGAAVPPGAGLEAGTAAGGAQHRRRRQRDVAGARGRRRAGLRHRAGQRADRRLGAVAHRPRFRCRRRTGGLRHDRPGRAGASDEFALFRQARAEIARPRRLRPVAGGRR